MGFSNRKQVLALSMLMTKYAIRVTKSTPQERIERIAKRMLAKDGDGVKLCYVTPEKVFIFVLRVAKPLY